LAFFARGISPIRRLAGCLKVLFLAALLLPAPALHAQERVRVTYANNSLSFLVPFIAKDRGFYARNGLNAELVQVRPSVAIAALVSGDADFAEVLGSAIRSAARGIPVRAVSTSIRAPFFSLVVHPSIKSIGELKGRTIGITSVGGTNQISTRLLFQHHGIDADREMKMLAIGEEKFMAEALRVRHVDAVMVAPPFSVMLKREGFPLLANTAAVVSIPFVGLSTTIDKIRQNRAQVKKALRAEVEALRYLRDNPAGATEVIRKRFAMDESMARESYSVIIDAFSKDGKISPEGIETLLDLERKAGLIAKSVTADQAMDASLGEEVLREMGK
jgi:ABC-type nitrate/sulfonate/bicarbonate transport system substrate-binding protein